MSAYKVYLAGPIHGCTDTDCKQWRSEAAGILGVHGLACIDPLVRDYRGREDSVVHELVATDKQWIEDSDIVLVNANVPSWGTAMEVLHAFVHGKHVVAFTNATSISPWLKAHTSELFGTLADALGWVVFGETAGKR
jgi:nucleoside 2-deoxyribosyltransferase